MVIVSFYTTEKFGRRTLIFTGGTGCFVCNIILGALGTQERTDTNLNATLGVICIWVLFYAGCLAGVGWGLTSEISTPRLRARTTGVVISMSMCFSLMFGYTVSRELLCKLTLGPSHAGLHRQGCPWLGRQDHVPVRLPRRSRPGRQLFHPPRGASWLVLCLHWTGWWTHVQRSRRNVRAPCPAAKDEGVCRGGPEIGQGGGSVEGVGNDWASRH